jgi:hypothetical protein
MLGLERLSLRAAAYQPQTLLSQGIHALDGQSGVADCRVERVDAAGHDAVVKIQLDGAIKRVASTPAALAAAR